MVKALTHMFQYIFLVSLLQLSSKYLENGRRLCIRPYHMKTHVSFSLTLRFLTFADTGITYITVRLSQSTLSKILRSEWKSLSCKAVTFEFKADVFFKFFEKWDMFLKKMPSRDRFPMQTCMNFTSFVQKVSHVTPTPCFPSPVYAHEL